MIASLNATTCLIYIYIQFFDASPTVILIGTYTFCCVQGTLSGATLQCVSRSGCPALIYVFLNTTIRKALLEKLSRGKLNFAVVLSSDAYAVDNRRTMSRTDGATRGSISIS